MIKSSKVTESQADLKHFRSSSVIKAVIYVIMKSLRQTTAVNWNNHNRVKPKVCFDSEEQVSSAYKTHTNAIRSAVDLERYTYHLSYVPTKPLSC